MPSPMSSADRPRTAAGTAATTGVTARPYIDDAQIIVDHGRGRFPQTEPLSFVHMPILGAHPRPAAPVYWCVFCVLVLTRVCTLGCVCLSEGGVISDAKLKPFIVDLVSHLKAGENLYIHCSNGNGRTGTVAAILLGVLYGLSSSDALDLSQRFRNHRVGTQGCMPDTHEQKMQVHRLLADADLAAAVKAAKPQRVRRDTQKECHNPSNKPRPNVPPLA